MWRSGTRDEIRRSRWFGHYDSTMVKASDVIAAARRRFLLLARIGADSNHAKKFAQFGEASAIAFAPTEIFGERYIKIATGSLFGPGLTLTAGLSPDHELAGGPVVTIGHRCVIGKGNSIVGVSSIVIGDDVWTGHNIYITDFNHGYEDLEVPPGLQMSAPRPVTIADGVWIGNGSTILGGSHIGKHSVIGAGAVVNGTIPDYSVAVGNPARVVRQHVPGRGWVRIDPSSTRRPSASG